MNIWLGSLITAMSLLGSVVPQTPPARQQDNEQSKMAAKLRAIVPEIKKHCPVPPRFMTYFPRLEKADDLFVNVQRVDSRGYEVVVAFTSDCEGQNNCGYAVLRGTKAPLKEIVPESKWVPVTLRHGIKARYYDSECYASCSYSVVAWMEGKWRYTVELKAEEKPIVVKAANSAVDN
jgi:hypothetical protein